MKHIESYKHKLAKELVYEWSLLSNYASNQEFGCCEAIYYGNSYGEGYAPYHYWGSCDCIENIREYKNLLKEDPTYEKYCQTFAQTMSEVNKDNLLFEEQRNNHAEFYKKHPCWVCPYRKYNKRKIELIYDIAFAREGMYTFAIEIKHKHAVEQHKITKSPIPIFEVDAEWVLSQIKPPKIIKGIWIC